ncbi:hypothetical protein [Streptomyces purpurascens]|uniref:hypothetical protein n=1 Tax=Streptomyces purpurascens TaxID=1924 RepID=UPI0033F6A4F6
MSARSAAPTLSVSAITVTRIPFSQTVLDDGPRSQRRLTPTSRTRHATRVLSAGGARRSDGAAARPTAVPYCVWANRRQGAMRVWIPRA